MLILSNYDLASIHRNTCVAILDAYLPHGNRGAFAAQIGVTPQWFTYFRQSDSFSMPSLELGKRIADQLPAPDHIRCAFYEHLAAAREAYDAAGQEVAYRTAKGLPIRDLVQEVADAFNEATFHADMNETRRQYEEAEAKALLIVNNTPPMAYPLEYLTVCSYLLHICSALDRVPQGLYWAMVGRHITQFLVRNEFVTWEERDRFEDLRYLLARDEALGLHNLGNPKVSLAAYDHAASVLQGHHRKKEWQADLSRNKLITLSTMPRFGIREAEALANSAELELERTGNHLAVLLTREALARAYIEYGGHKNLATAERMLGDVQSGLDRQESVGQLHFSIVLKTLTRLHWVRQDRQSWDKTVHQVLTLTQNAGLFHQYHNVLQRYGGAIG
ncbi:hypothetical protein GC175_31815 [bacterium]|nr:hypothetical protein [bacterium]